MPLACNCNTVAALSCDDQSNSILLQCSNDMFSGVERGAVAGV